METLNEKSVEQGLVKYKGVGVRFLAFVIDSATLGFVFYSLQEFFPLIFRRVVNPAFTLVLQTIMEE